MSNDCETEELLRRLEDGDRHVEDELFERYRERLRRMVAVRLDPRIAGRLDPSDIVQETLAEASAELADFLAERPLPFFPWLRRLAGDRLIAAYRQHVGADRRTVNREVRRGPNPFDASTARLAEKLVDPGSSPSQRAARNELIGLVHQTLATLGTNDREVLIMRYLEHLKFTEIAAVLGISENAVKVRHVRAIERLRIAMSRYHHGMTR